MISFSSAGEADLAPWRLTEEMIRRLVDPGALHARDLFDSVAGSFFTHFQLFKTNTLITGVIMTPPVQPPPAMPNAQMLEAEDAAPGASDIGIEKFQA